MNTIEQYQLGERLGSGGFATVWLGYDPGLDGHVAIKVLGDNWVGQPDVVRRFLDEARLLWRAEDSRVVDVFTIGELSTGQPWFAMEYADRGTLEDRLLQGALTTADALGLIAEMGRCIAAIHRLGAVHRDVKPGNFLIRSMTQGVSDPIPGLAVDERLKIGDLGFAKVLANSSGFTVAGGSPLYMPPEQTFTSAEVGFAADVFSLGVCAWQVLTGAPPQADGPGRAIVRADPSQLPALSTFREDISPAVEAVIHKAIQPRVEDRWQSAEVFVDALVEASTQAPFAAVASAQVATSTSTSDASPSRVNRTLVLLAVLLLAAIAAVGALVVRGGGPDLSDAPSWFVPPESIDVDDIEVSTEENKTSVVAVLPSGFGAACDSFVSDALANGYIVVSDECRTAQAVASVQAANGATAVMAQLSDGRVGWQFVAE